MTEQMVNKRSFLDQLFDELCAQCEFADRLSDKLRSELEKLSETERQQLVSRKKDGVTPLFTAAKKGFLDIVKYLLVKCKADTNKYCKSYTENEREMTAVMVARNVTVVHCLLEHGAKDVSKALLEHIRGSRFEVVHYLISSGTKLNDVPTEEGKTCLDYIDNDPQMYQLLLKNGAKVNALNALHETPLHTAVKGHKLWKVEQLLKYGADPKSKNNKDEDVLRLTCLRGHEDIFKYLMEHVEYSVDTRANAHELMGAFYMSQDDPTYSPMVLEHWRTALKIRQNDGGQFLERKLNEEPPIKDVSQFRTEDELAKLTNSLPSILVQTVLISHRILGHKHPVTYKILSNLFNVYSMDFDIKNAFKIMMCINNIHARSNSGLVNELTSKATVIASQIIWEIATHNGFIKDGINFDDVLATVEIMWSQLANPMIGKDGHIKIMAMLFMLLIMSKSDDLLTGLNTFVTKMVRKMYRNQNGRSLLHMIASIKRSQNQIPHLKHLNFVRLTMTQFLLDCGHLVDTLDRSRSTPLHLEISNECHVDVINCLLKNGAHIDRANDDGIRPYLLLDYVPGFNTFKYVTLKCLAARTVVDHKVPYKHLNFPTLDAFIEMH